jgi:hypothetical protein
VTTMTCHQLGGPCEMVHVGDDANEIIENPDSHLRFDALPRDAGSN